MVQYRILERRIGGAFAPFGVAFERDGRILLFAPAWRASRPLAAASLEELNDSHCPADDFRWRDVQVESQPVAHPIDLLRRAIAPPTVVPAPSPPLPPGGSLRVLSVRNLIQSAIAPKGVAAFTGTAQPVEALFTETALRQFEQAHPGVFAFLGFDPQHHAAVADLVRSGTLTADLDRRVLLLLLLDREARWPTAIDRNTYVLPAGSPPRADPALEIIQGLLPGLGGQLLPGLVFFERLTSRCTPTLVGLGDLQTSADVLLRCRRAFELAGESSEVTKQQPDPPADSFASHFLAAWTSAGLTALPGAALTPAGWLSDALQLALSRRYDLVAPVRLGR